MATHGACVTHVCRALKVLSLARCILIQISMTLLNMGDAYSLLSFRRSVNSIYLYEIYDYVNDMTTW
jgi:hypothetical protein